MRENSQKIDYMKKVNDKPWGKEYLAYQNEHVGIWILHVDKGQETSLHCHFKKDTILVPLCNGFKILLYNTFKILDMFELLYVPRNTFHGIHSYANDSILMEIEVYTDQVTYTDKNDLLRLRDVYGRDKTKYETSVEERTSNEGETMNFHSPGRFHLGKTTVTVTRVTQLDELHSAVRSYERICILQGKLFHNGSVLTSGSFIERKATKRDWVPECSLLTEHVDLLCLSNDDHGYSHKIIYSMHHLVDLIYVHNNVQTCASKIGLTSGCFDILHDGHITNLKRGKEQCDILIVCISSDAQIRRIKGSSRPINEIADRMRMLIQFDFIDYIMAYDETDDIRETELDNIMNVIKPWVWIKGSDYRKEDILKKHPGLQRIFLTDILEGKSTTSIIKRSQLDANTVPK